MYHNEIKRIIEKILKGEVDKYVLMEYLINNFDCEKIYDSDGIDYGGKLTGHSSSCSQVMLSLVTFLFVIGIQWAAMERTNSCSEKNGMS